MKIIRIYLYSIWNQISEVITTHATYEINKISFAHDNDSPLSFWQWILRKWNRFCCHCVSHRNAYISSSIVWLNYKLWKLFFHQRGRFHFIPLNCRNFYRRFISLCFWIWYDDLNSLTMISNLLSVTISTLWLLENDHVNFPINGQFKSLWYTNTYLQTGRLRR